MAYEINPFIILPDPGKPEVLLLTFDKGEDKLTQYRCLRPNDLWSNFIGLGPVSYVLDERQVDADSVD